MVGITLVGVASVMDSTTGVTVDTVAMDTDGIVGTDGIDSAGEVMDMVVMGMVVMDMVALDLAAMDTAMHGVLLTVTDMPIKAIMVLEDMHTTQEDVVTTTVIRYLEIIPELLL